MTYLLSTRQKDLDGFTVRRILPNAAKRMIGPFVFIDHMGPADFTAGEGIDVRPHPHIGLSTITYLMEGSLLHRDSLGNNLEIQPGDVNWMTAGKGIVHSERETIEVKSGQHKLNGMQCWMALPKNMAEVSPSFTHIKRASLPHHMFDGVLIRLIAGEALGLTSPIKTYSPMFYLDILAKPEKEISRPNPDQECMVYVLDGSVTIEGTPYEAGDVIILEDEQCINSTSHCRLLMLGGEEWPEVPILEWNFVSFDRERIEKAKDDWREQRFPKIPGDDNEFTPLP